MKKMEKRYHHFSYEALGKVTKREVLGHDAVIEGGIGNNVERYLYFRDRRYRGLYIGMDLDSKSTVLPAGLIREYGDCLEPYRLHSLLSRYHVSNPIFVTNSVLYFLIQRYEDHMDNVVEALSGVFRKQLHIRPAGNFPLTKSTVYYQETATGREFNNFMKFVEESRKRGWKEDVVGKNIVLLKQEQ
jgi:hypothetical protein